MDIIEILTVIVVYQAICYVCESIGGWLARRKGGAK